MAAINLPQIVPASAGMPSNPLPFSLSNVGVHRIYRAHVTPRDWRQPERTIFVEAFGERAALERMAQAVAAIDWCTREDAAERLYNCYSARELLEDGVSADPLTRLFETGWSGDKAIAFVTHPLILVEDAAPLIRAWAAIEGTDRQPEGRS
jgi:hypothetical protein